MIEIAAAINEIWIVALIPLTRNLMLIQPEFVLGSITYHPHAVEDEHPAKVRRSKDDAATLFKYVLLVLQNLAQESSTSL